MAEKPAAAPEAAGDDKSAPMKKKLPIKTLIVILAVMVVEGAALVVVLGMLGPKQSQAQIEPKHLEDDESEQTQEIELVSEKFQNLTTGRVWIWDVEIYVQVKNKNAEAVEQILTRRKAEINEQVNQVFSRAQHAQLKEPERQTILRQITALMEKIVPGQDGKPLIERIIIPRCRGFPTDR